jgi:cytochrome c
MKKTCMIIGLAAIMSVYAGLALSGEASVEQGEQLFNDPTLGGSTNEKSCGSCHPDGRGLKESGTKANLAQMINTCIEKPLGGQALESDSVEMESLVQYIKSL